MADLREQLQSGLVDRYVLERELGRGGMATVYLAHDLRHDRQVALKVLHQELAATLGPERFQREIRTTARLQHPHILPVLDSGESAGQLWYTMPFVRGESLRDCLLRESQLPVSVAVELARQVALALDYAHREGVVHRDLKPENVLLSEGQALVADFGIAKPLSAAGASQLTETGVAVGTPAYMSPEQAGGGELDGRSDVYALGCVLYEMLAGEPPYTGPTPQAVFAKRVLEPVPHVRTLRDTVPPHIEQVLTRALAKIPADRFGSAAEFAQALVAPWPHEVASAQAPTTLSTALEVSRSGTKRGKMAFVLGAFLVLGMLSIGIKKHFSNAVAELDTNLLGIAPFDVFDPKLQVWKEGMVDLLARSLDGAGSLRTVSPTTGLRAWRGRADRESAEAFAHRTGAGVVLYGSLLPAGKDSVRLSGSVLDATQHTQGVEFDIRASVDGMGNLVDSVTLRVLRGLGQTRPVGAARESAWRSHSLPALRAFLRGEQAFRRTEWDSARSAYGEAIAQDTSFAMAYWRLGAVQGWSSEIGDSLSISYYLRAGALNHGLAPRESLLIVCDSLMASLTEGATTDSSDYVILTRLLGTAERVTQRYPTDPESWVALGEARSHFAYGLGVTSEMTLAAFERAIALDSAYAPAYIHAVSLAEEQDPGKARLYALRYLGLRPSKHFARAMRTVRVLLDPTAPRAETESLLDSLSPEEFVQVYDVFADAPDSAEMAIQLLRRVRESAARDDPLRADIELVNRLTYRGHVREALDVIKRGVFPTDRPLFTELALLGVIPYDAANARFRERLEGKARRPIGELRFAPAWWASQGDTASLRLYMARLRSFTLRASADGPSPYMSRYRLGVAEAYLASVRGDTTEAVTRFRALPPLVGHVWLERLTLVKLLATSGQARAAMDLLDQGFPVPYRNLGYVVWALEQARLAERLGEREKAQRWYGFVLKAWRYADPELRPMVAEASGALQRLATERRQ